MDPVMIDELVGYKVRYPEGMPAWTRTPAGMLGYFRDRLVSSLPVPPGLGVAFFGNTKKREAHHIMLPISSEEMVAAIHSISRKLEADRLCVMVPCGGGKWATLAECPRRRVSIQEHRVSPDGVVTVDVDWGPLLAGKQFVLPCNDREGA